MPTSSVWDLHKPPCVRFIKAFQNNIYTFKKKNIQINLKQWFQYNALKCYWYRAAHASITQTDILKWVQSFSHITNWHVSSKLVNRETKWTSVKYFPGLSAQTISITAKILALYAPSSNTDSSKCIFHSLPQSILMRKKQVPVIKSGSFFKAYNIYFISILMLIEKRNIFVEFQIQNLEGFWFWGKIWFC